MLVARLTEEGERRANNLAKGGAASFDDYKHEVGFIKALNFVASLCEEVERDLYGHGDKKI